MDSYRFDLPYFTYIAPIQMSSRQIAIIYFFVSDFYTHSLPDNEFFVDRDPGSFDTILNYHRSNMNIRLADLKSDLSTVDTFIAHWEGLANSTILTR